MFTVFLLAVVVVRLAARSLDGASPPGARLAAAVVAALLGALLGFLWLRALAKDGTWRLERTWYEGAFALATLYIVCAAWVFLTGRTPTKYSSHPVPRPYGVNYLADAVIPAVIGLLAYVREKSKRA